MAKVKAGKYVEKAGKAVRANLSNSLRTAASTMAKISDEKYRKAQIDIYQIRSTR
jgi:hypothetical protein